MKRRCIICNTEIAPRSGSSRKARGDKITCSATCRKRLSRRRAAGHQTQIDLPGQGRLPFSGDGHRCNGS